MATREEQVISAVCNNREIGTVIGENPELFGAFANVVEFIKEYYMLYRSVPSVEVIQQKFDDIEITKTTAPVDYYVEQLKHDFVKTRIEKILERAATAIREDAPGEVLEKMQTNLAKLGQYTTNARDLNITDPEAAVERIESLRTRSENNEGVPGIPFRIKSVDASFVTGMAPGHSIVFMGYTGRGKSMFADVVATSAWSQGYHPMIVSLEMSPEEQSERIYAMMSSGLFTISDLSRGMIDLDDFRDWGNKNLSGSAPFTIVSNQGVSNVTPNVVQAKIDLHRPDIVFLDYMQLMMDNAKTGNMVQRMLNLSREIKMLAVSNNIPIVSITAVTDEDKDKRDAPPRLSQISWSSGIEYDANLAMAIHRHDDSNLVEIVGRKNRHGSLFDFYFDVDFNAGRWEEKFDI